MADLQFLEALRVAAGLEPSELAEAARLYIERGMRGATRAFENTEVTFERAADPDAQQLLAWFFPDDDISPDEMWMSSALVLLMTYQTATPAHPHTLTHKLLEHTLLMNGSHDTFTPSWASFELCEPDEISTRIPDLLIQGLLLETPALDEYPDNARHIGGALAPWLGEGVSFWSNTRDGRAYHSLGGMEKISGGILNHVIVGVEAQRAMVLWVVGES